MPIPWKYKRNAGALLFAVGLIFYISQTLIPSLSFGRPAGRPISKYAFASLLTSTVSGPNTTDADDQSNVYFISARLLTYQLLHAPETRSSQDIPFLILVTPDVSQRQRDRLTKDGATVIAVDYLRQDWIVPSWPQWRDVLAKLRVMELVEYSKILLLDLDTVLYKPLDGVFDDPATEPSSTLSNASAILPDEAPLPSQYMFAGVRNLNMNHDFPSTIENGDFQMLDYLNAGFFVIMPSLEVLEYYLSVLPLQGRFDPSLPQQNMLNYVHRFDGNMPWKPLDPTWNANYPVWEDHKNCVMSMQEKWWSPPRPEFEKLFLSWRWRMEGYFQGMDMAEARTEAKRRT